MSKPLRNSSRYADRLSFTFMLWMILCAVLVAAGGVTVAVYKSEQVAVRTDINNLRRQIAICNMNANQYRAKTNAMTNRWAMLDRLSQDGSTLHDIDRNQIEIARSSAGQRSVAYVSGE